MSENKDSSLELSAYLIRKLETLEDQQRDNHQEVLEKFSQINDKWDQKYTDLKYKVDAHDHTFGLLKWLAGSGGLLMVFNAVKDFFFPGSK